MRAWMNERNPEYSSTASRGDRVLPGAQLGHRVSVFTDIGVAAWR